MIDRIAGILSNTTAANVAMNTTASVSIETTLKSIGRPGFILIDKDIAQETKNYAATKEFLYQAICLAVYLLLIPPIFKAGSYKLGKKIFGKEHPEFFKFKNMKEYLDYHKYAKRNLNDRSASLSKIKSREKFKHDGLREDLLTKENPEMYHLMKGTIEAGSFIGSILGLAILAPQISHHLIHPIMKVMRLENNTESKTREQEKN